jgi:hypothetical protein
MNKENKQQRNPSKPRMRRQPTPIPIVRVEASIFETSPDGHSFSFLDLSDEELSPLVEFIRILDRWDREMKEDTNGE